jgi:hypothetical protein
MYGHEMLISTAAVPQGDGTRVLSIKKSTKVRNLSGRYLRLA